MTGLDRIQVLKHHARMSYDGHSKKQGEAGGVLTNGQIRGPSD